MKRAYETVTAELLAMEQADIITSSGEGDPLTKYEIRTRPNGTKPEGARSYRKSCFRKGKKL